MDRTALERNTASPSGRWLRVQRWALRGLGAVARRHGRDRGRAPHLLTGERGEMEALFFLRAQGYLLVDRRWRSPEHNGDLDLVGWDGETLAIVEVKTRTARDLAPAAAAVDDTKRRVLRAMARSYRRRIPRRLQECPVRFDLVSVYLLAGGVECELLRGAFPVHAEGHAGGYDGV